MNEENNEQSVIKTLEKMILEHDITYEDSDDGKQYSSGREQIKKIMNYVSENNIDRKTFTEIWNAAVDKKIAEAFRNNYYLPIKY